MNRIVIIVLSALFTLFSFGPSFSELLKRAETPPDRYFVLEHNYMFDYGFYLSRIRQGQEGHFLVTEKYYNHPHSPSLFQIVYLYLGKTGAIFGLGPPEVYHLSRLVFGFILLYLTGELVMKLFPGQWQIWAFLVVSTSASYPIKIDLPDGSVRFSAYMGWWSAIDPLHRITFIPHVVIGQIFILQFIRLLGYTKNLIASKPVKIAFFCITGVAAGIIFPPTLIVVYPVLVMVSAFDVFRSAIKHKGNLKMALAENSKPIAARIAFVLATSLVFIYLKAAFLVQPWKALALFDIQHRTLVPYPEYYKALGITLPLGLIGLILAGLRRDWKFVPMAAWIGSVFLLFRIFEGVPEQSPLRFTEAAVHIPLSAMSVYLIHMLYKAVELIFMSSRYRVLASRIWRASLLIFTSAIIISGFLVMHSSFLWWKDQGDARRVGGWQVPLGVQLAMPLRDFMEPIIWMRNNIKKDKVILTYITAGNFIPAYAGQYVYIGHANTPDESGKEKIAAKFFGGKMGEKEAVEFLKAERIDYIYFGIQEKEFGVQDLKEAYPFLNLKEVHANGRVEIFKVD